MTWIDSRAWSCRALLYQAWPAPVQTAVDMGLPGCQVSLACHDSEASKGVNRPGPGILGSCNKEASHRQTCKP
eukprot:scaffold59156_cov17-Prasinocladus_malaysianus.AAC.1